MSGTSAFPDHHHSHEEVFMRVGPFIAPVILGLVLAGSAAAAPADLTPLLAKIKAVGPGGKGNADASRAWKELAAAGLDALFPILAACDDADPIAVNWLLAAAEAVAERELNASKPLPADKLEAFVKDTKHHGSARRVAYELLVKIDPKTPDRLLPGMLDDPGAELRRDAVAVVIDQAKAALASGNKETAATAYRKAFAASRDRDQVDQIAKALKDLGVEVDLAKHLGFVTKWQLAVPFDNTAGKGFDVAFAPEKGVDLSAVYKGKNDAEARWAEFTTTDPYGMMDLNKLIGKLKGTTTYAYVVVESPEERPVQVRVGCINSIKVFVNGKELLSREECHHGMRMDQHILPATLKKGRNEILLKVSQNEQTEAWAQDWKFQLRLTDAIGGAVPFKIGTTETQKHREEKKENE
jgi:hypothetical protein